MHDCKNFTTDKTTNEDYYFLIMSAIAEEMKMYGKCKGDVYLAVGLPLYWVKSQKGSFEEYLLMYACNHSLDNLKKYVKQNTWKSIISR